MKSTKTLIISDDIHPEFAEALRKVADGGVLGIEYPQPTQLSDVLRKLSDERIRHVQMPQPLKPGHEIGNPPDRILGNVEVFQRGPERHKIVGYLHDVVP